VLNLYAYKKAPVASLLPYARNPRTHSPQQIEQLRASIREFGFTNPLLIDESDRLIAGHGRLLAAQAEGMTELPAIVVSGLTEDQRRALIIADNQLALGAGWDDVLLGEELSALSSAGFDLDVIGFSDEELARLLEPGTDGLTDPDDVPETPEEPASWPGDVWALGQHRLICGDSTDAETRAKLMNGGQADLCFTSPPYGVGLDYGTYKDTFENCRNLLRAVAPAIFDALRPGGFCLTNFADIVAAREINGTDDPSEYPMALEYFPVFTGSGFILNTRRIWVKPHARVNAPWTANSNRSACDWEHIWAWLKPGGTFINARRDDSWLGVWDTSKMDGVEIGKDRHPAAFPVGVVIMALAVYSNPGDCIFEPFSGTGTVIVAAERAGRIVRAAEIDPRYTDMAVLRWQQFTGKQATLESDGRTFDAVKEERHAAA
jgi:DNA modification methylase